MRNVITLEILNRSVDFKSKILYHQSNSYLNIYPQMEDCGLRIKLIGCPSTKNEVVAMEHFPAIDCEFLDFSLHALPCELNTALQQSINASQHYDLIILTYGWCSRAVVGLVSAAVPLIMPNVHDCISLLLGSDVRRQQLSALNPAVYYFSQGWLDYGRDPYDEYLEYVDKYGQEDAAYLIQTLYGRYQEAVFVRTCAGEKLEECRRRVQMIACFFNWKVSEIAGDLGLLTKLVNGEPCPAVIRIQPGNPISIEEGEVYAD